MTVNVLLTTGKWFEVADADRAESSRSGSLVVGKVNSRSVTGLEFRREFGPGSWVTWDVEGER